MADTEDEDDEEEEEATEDAELEGELDGYCEEEYAAISNSSPNSCRSRQRLK